MEKRISKRVQSLLESAKIMQEKARDKVQKSQKIALGIKEDTAGKTNVTEQIELHKEDLALIQKLYNDSMLLEMDITAMAVRAKEALNIASILEVELDITKEEDVVLNELVQRAVPFFVTEGAEVKTNPHELIKEAKKKNEETFMSEQNLTRTYTSIKNAATNL